VINPEDFEPGLDDLPRSRLREGALGDMPGAVADVLDGWLHRNHGVISGRHYVGAFLDELAAKGYRVTPIPAGPSFEELLPAPTE